MVEPVSARREELLADGIRVYAGVEEMLDTESPEGVLIAAPSDQHPGLVSTFVAAGIPMLCEKPLGIHVQQTAEAAMIALEAGVMLQVGYWRRFAPALQALRERIRDGELGVITQLSCLQWDQELPTESFRAHSGGIAVDMGVHEFDQTRWLLGQEFEWVSATAAGPNSAPRDPSDPDAATLLGQLSGGAAVTISLGRRFPHADSCWLEIWGTEGYERVPFMWDAAGDEVFRSSMRRQAEAFARATRTGESEGAGGTDAVAALTVAEMAAQSLTAHGAQIRPAAVMAR